MSLSRVEYLSDKRELGFLLQRIKPAVKEYEEDGFMKDMGRSKVLERITELIEKLLGDTL